MTGTVQTFALTLTDMAYAVTQQQLNEALAEFLLSVKPQIKFAYDIDDNGNPIPPANPDAPQVTFNATVTYGSSAPRQAIPIIDMSNPGSNNSVKFTIGFTSPSGGSNGATFTDSNYDVDYQQNSSQFTGESWAVTFAVPLVQQDNVAPSPASGQAATVIQALQDQYGQAFSLSQILIDLSSVAASDETYTSAPANFKRGAWIDFVACLALTLKTDGAAIFANPLVAGYAITKTGEADTPTFTPTEVEIVILGNSGNPQASLLVFGMAIDGTLASNWQTDFGGVDLIDDPSVTPGLALVRADLFTGFLQKQLAASNYPATIGRYVTVACSDENFSYSTASSTVPTFAPKQPTATSASLGICNMNGGASVESTAGYSGEYSETQYTYTTSTSAVGYLAAATDWYPTLQISGSFGCYMSDSTNSRGNGANWTSPIFYFAWNANFDFQAVNDAGGGTQGIGVAYDAATSSFPSTYTSMDDSTASSWGTVPQDTQQLVAGLLHPLISSIPGSFETAISQSLKSISLFVFPGMGNFTFQSPGVNGAFTMMATVSYENGT